MNCCQSRGFLFGYLNAMVGIDNKNQPCVVGMAGDMRPIEI